MSAERLNNLSAKGLAEGDRYYCNPHFSQALSSEGAEEQRGRGVEGQRGRGVEEQRGRGAEE